MAHDRDDGGRRRGHGFDRGAGIAPSGGREVKALTPVERSRSAVLGLERSNDGVKLAIDMLEQAHAANKPDAWDEARARLARALKLATEDRTKAHATRHEAPERERLAQAKSRLAQLEDQSKTRKTLTEAPTGWMPVTCEAKVRAILDAPAGPGSIKTAFEHKIAALRVELSALAACECEVLASRLRRAMEVATQPVYFDANGKRLQPERPKDPLGEPFQRLNAENRGALLKFLDSARYRTPTPTAAHKVANQPVAASAPTGDLPATLANRSGGTATPDAAPSEIPRRSEMEQAFDRPHTGAAVQRVASSEATQVAIAPAAIAQRGVDGAGGPLPHLAQIQASFGHHNVSAVQAHQGPAARDATRALGAQAYASGNSVAFGSSPDLHTAAHEAAHAVQQRGGVQLKGAIDQPGDAYERHADAVADRVVAGQSAESLLDQMANGQMANGGAATDVVQRRSEPGALVSATEYLKLNDRATGDAIMRHLLAITPPRPHPRLVWHNLGTFYKHFFKQLDRIIYIFDHPPDLAQLVYPQDPYATVDAVRPVAGKQHGAAIGPWDWQPSVGTALAEMIEEALVASLYRIGPRWLHIAELAGDVSGASVIVDPDAIPRSHPMDRAVVPALCQQGVLDVLADKQHKAKPKSSTKPVAQPAGVGLRPVQYVWLGKETHGELWNWVRAISPADATVEEVSAQLFQDTAERHGEKHGDYLAFAMTSAPPLFGLPGHWAIKFDEGKAYAPATVPASTDEAERNLVTLAGSSVADDQALREANVAPDAKGTKPVARTGAAVGTLAQDALSQATYLKKTLASWHLDKAVDPTLTFLGRRMGELADASKLTKWQPVLAGQKDKLSQIGAGIVEIDRAVATMGLSSKQGDDARPLRDILRLYADATGASHLMQTSETLLQRAAALQATLPLRGVQSATRDLGASADMLRDSTPLGDHERNRLSGAASQIDEDSRKLQSRMMRGDKVDPNEIDQVTVNAGEIALKSKVHAIAVQLEALEKAAHDAGDGFFAAIAALFSSDFRGLEFETQVMKDSLAGVTRDMDWQAQAAGLGMRVENAKDLDDESREMMRVRKEALARAQGQFATMAANDRIKNFLSKGATLVKWQSFRTACVKLAVLIGVSIVGGAIGGMVARGVGGMMMSSAGAAAMEDLSAGAQMIARGSGLVTETAVTSAGQTAIFGDKLSDAFLENMLMSLGSAGILKAIGHQAETLAQVERASEGLWAKAGAAGKLVLEEGAAITGHTIMGAALGYVSHKIVTGKTQPPPETLEEWLLQGASIAVGRYVGKAMEARAANAKRLAAIKGFAAGQKLLTATTTLREHALRAEANPRPTEAAELLAMRHDVLSDEIKALDELEQSPELMKASGLHLREVKQMRADVHGQLAEVHSRAFAETPLHLAGLEELIPGAQWKGSQEQIVAAIESAKHAGVKIDAKPPQSDGHTWHVELEGRPLEFVEREKPSAAKGDFDAPELSGLSRKQQVQRLLDEIERGAGGLRRLALNPLEPAEIARLQEEFASLGGDPAILRFNRGAQTGFVDQTDHINVRGDVNPIQGAHHPRSAMSSKAVLGHELGHRAHRGTKLPIGAWNDEFRASYWAAKNLPNLSDEDRIYLILDAMERAREAGVSFKPNALMRKILYGY